MLHRLLNLYPGEGRQAFLFALLAFLVAMGISGGITLADGRFLEVMGVDALPYAYFGVAGLMLVVTPLVMRAMGRIAIRSLFLLMLIVGGGSLALMSLLPTSWFAVKLVADTVFFVLLTGLWNFIDQSYDLQDAKRHYGLFSATLICGFASGSGLVSLLIDTVGGTGLLLVLSALLGIAALLIVPIGRLTKPLPALPEEEISLSAKSFFRRIWRSPFTLCLLTLSSLIALSEFMMEYSYMDALETAFGSNRHELTRFLGLGRGVVYLSTVILGAFCFGRIVKRIGINNVTLIPASYFLVVFAASSHLPGAVMAILGLLAVEGMLTVVEDNAFHLLLNAVPAALKSRLRVLVQNFIEPAAMLITALLLLLFKGQATWMGIGLAATALGAALVLRVIYPRAILRNLRESTRNSLERHEPPTKIAPLWEELSNVEGSLRSENPVERGGAILETLRGTGERKEALAALDRLLAGKEDEEACVGLTVLALHGSPHHFDTAIPFLMHASADVQRAAMSTLAHLANASARRHSHRILAELVGSRDPLFRSHCLRALERLCDARHTRELVTIAADLDGRERLQTENILHGFGRRAAPTLLAMVTDSSLSPTARLIACRVLKREHLNELHHLVEAERQEAFLLLFHRHTLEGEEGVDFVPLRRLLDERFWTHLELLLHLLVADAPLVCQGLRSDNEKVHSHAVESLEKSTPSRLFRILSPLVDDGPIEQRLRAYSGRVLDLHGLIEHLTKTAVDVEWEILREMQLQQRLNDRPAAPAANGVA